MIQETALYIHHTLPQAKRVSVFATIGTNQAGLYQTYLNYFGIETLPLTKTEQEQIMEIIYGVKAGQDLNQLKKRVIKIAKLQTEKAPKLSLPDAPTASGTQGWGCCYPNYRPNSHPGPKGSGRSHPIN